MDGQTLAAPPARSIGRCMFKQRSHRAPLIAIAGLAGVFALPAAAPDTTPPAKTASPPPAGAVLPETIASGTARLRGASGCAKQAFSARVSGRSIAAVAFYVDGRLMKNITSMRSAYRMTVRPGRYSTGRHKVVARVRFTAASGTQSRRLRLTFRRCAQAAVAPRFTG
jgi:hypothetical protein